MASIIIEDGRDKGRVVPFGDHQVVLFGRSPHCQISFDDHQASRVHFLIERRREGFLVVDQQSRNGTYLNEHQISCASLQFGDEIRAGGTSFTFSEDDEARQVGGPFGEIVGGCRIEGRLGRGGMATVYLATQLSLGRKVALKILSRRHAESPATQQRFHSEAQASIDIAHPSIVEVFQFGVEDGRHYSVMELMKHGSLQDHLNRLDKLPCADAIPVFIDICRGLSQLEQRRLIHRDIKPDNILISEGGGAKLGDLGVAIRLDDAADEVGRLVGTPQYMSPEQANMTVIDHTTDIYALGCSIYETVGGKHPFAGDSRDEIFEKKWFGSFTPLRQLEPSVPRKLNDIVDRMLSVTPQRRPQSANEVEFALAECLAASTDTPSLSGFDLSALETTPVEVKQMNELAALPPGLRVLVVDDQKVSVMAAERACKVLGCTTKTARTGMEALTLLDNGEFDILLTDRIMPAMSGDVLALNVKNRHPDMPVVMLTSLGAQMEEEGDHPECVDLVLSKPVTKARLESAFQLVCAGMQN